MIAAESLRVTCSHRGQQVGPVIATAWIDVSSVATAACARMRDAQCQPSRADPQAHQIAYLRYNASNEIRLDVADPP
jgi:hypothetical protein